MPYSLITDTFETDPIWEVLSGGSGQLIDSLQASWVRMNTRSSHQLSNGYLTESAALACCRGRRGVLQKLTEPALGRAPRLHSKGDKCLCLGDDWIDGYAYRVHKFLKRNPSKAEYRRNAAQNKERRDARLKAAVYERDGGCCRYCRSGPLNRKITVSTDRRKVPQFDHVDWDKTGEDNLVTSCASCNEYKGKRRPEEADMVLLPVPSAVQCEAWAEQGLMLFDRPSSTDETTDRPATRPRADHEHDGGHDRGLEDGHNHAPNGVSTPWTPLPDQQDQQQNGPMKGVVSGRGGSRSGSGPPGLSEPFSPDPYGQEPRAPDSPDIYTKRSRPTQW